MFEVGIEREEGDFMKKYIDTDVIYPITALLLEKTEEGDDWSGEIEELVSAITVFEKKEQLTENKEKILEFYNEICPESSREKSLAITKLEESFLWLEQAMNK